MKFWSSEKATAIWKKSHFFLTLLSDFKKKVGYFFQISRFSHNIWTLQLPMFFEDLAGRIISQVKALYLLTCPKRFVPAPLIQKTKPHRRVLFPGTVIDDETNFSVLFFYKPHRYNYVHWDWNHLKTIDQYLHHLHTCVSFFPFFCYAHFERCFSMYGSCYAYPDLCIECWFADDNLDWKRGICIIQSTDYGHTKAKSQILCGPNSNPTPKYIFGSWI